jgi:RNA polymerase sigma-70 factor (ECF subfamily)
MSDTPTRRESGVGTHRFETIVVPEIEVLLRVATSMTHNVRDAEDLVQDTLLRAFRAIDGFDGRHPRAWLLTIMRNTEINRHRRRRPGLLTPDQAEQNDQAADEGASAEDVALERSLSRDVAAALAGLPDPFREAVELIDLAGLSYAEAAEVAGVPEGTLMSRAHRARRKLRSQLRKSEVDLRGAP